MADIEKMTIAAGNVAELAADPHAVHAKHGATSIINIEIFCANCQKNTTHKMSVEGLEHVARMNASARLGLERAVGKNLEVLKAAGRESEHVAHVHVDRDPEMVVTCGCGRALKFPLVGDPAMLKAMIDAHGRANVGQVSMAQASAAQAEHDAKFRKLTGAQ